jgi:hypothetical protein
MKSQDYVLVRYDADEGKVFDYAEPRYEEDPETKEKVQIHLYAKTLFLGVNDSISNYIEVDA